MHLLHSPQHLCKWVPSHPPGQSVPEKRRVGGQVGFRAELKSCETLTLPLLCRRQNEAALAAGQRRSGSRTAWREQHQ